MPKEFSCCFCTGSYKFTIFARMLGESAIAVVIPCFNVEKEIEKVVEGIPSWIDEIVLVNDASSDGTAAIIEELKEKAPDRIRSVTHPVNQGVGGAVMTGMKAVLQRGISDIVVKIDGDGQMDPDFLEPLLRPLVDNCADFTKGNRFRDFKALKKMPFIRRIGNMGLSLLIKSASGYWNLFDPSNGFFAVKKENIQALDFERLDRRFFFESSLIIELYYTGAVVKDIPIPACYNEEKSNLSELKCLISFPGKLLRALFRRIAIRYFIMDFSIVSLYILLGVPLFLFGFIFGLAKWIYYASLSVPAPTGTILIATLCIVLGFQLILGFIQYDMSASNPFKNNNDGKKAEK